MATTIYQTPGVHVQEVPPAPGPIQGASTSVAAFVGVTQTESNRNVGVTQTESNGNTVSALSSYRDFVRVFQDPDSGEMPTDDLGLTHLANGVYGFFNNGGTRCYVTRIPPQGSLKEVIDEEQAQFKKWQDSATAQAQRWLDDHDVKLTSSQRKQLQTIIGSFKEAPLREQAKDIFELLHSKDLIKPVVNKLVHGLMRLLQGLWDGFVQVVRAARNSRLSSTNIVDVLAALDPYDDISIVAAPGLTSKTNWSALIDHCETSEPNRFAVLDAPEGVDWASEQPASGTLPNKSDYAAIYYPWVMAADAISGGESPVPPSGQIAGIYARVDAQRGVFKAPANEAVYGALDLQAYVSGIQQKQLNDPLAVNCIRRLNGGILVWGARTVQAANGDPFEYVSTRRTFNYIRQSLENGTQWAVFEPNTQALWGQITRNVTSFLTTLWQDGGLFGSTAAEAFYVKCDEDTNPPDVRAIGQVITEVGVAITQPAEFVVFQLGLTSGSATPSTSN